jgi:hypothetical protein
VLVLCFVIDARPQVTGDRLQVTRVVWELGRRAPSGWSTNPEPWTMGRVGCAEAGPGVGGGAAGGLGRGGLEGGGLGRYRTPRLLSFPGAEKPAGMAGFLFFTLYLKYIRLGYKTCQVCWGLVACKWCGMWGHYFGGLVRGLTVVWEVGVSEIRIGKQISWNWGSYSRALREVCPPPLFGVANSFPRTQRSGGGTYFSQ